MITKLDYMRLHKWSSDSTYVRRYRKKCEEFAICCEMGDANVIFLEPSNQRTTLYQIIIKGSGRVSKLFDTNHVDLDDKTNSFVDLKKFKGYNTIFQSYTPTYIYGFNTLDLDQDWDGKLITDSFVGDDRSWLVCFDGRPIINGTQIEPRDYAKLENKNYDIELNNAIVGVFTKV